MKTVKYSALLLSLLFAFCGGPSGGRQGVKEEKVKFKVKTQRVTYREIRKSLLYSGTVEAYKKQNIIPKINGKIKRIYVEEGQKVSEGQLLAELDTEQAEIQLRQAEAALEAARANLKDAERNFHRAVKLLKEQAISRQQYEKMELALKAARAQKKQAEAAVEMARFLIRSSRLRAPFSGIITNKLKEEGDFVNPGMGGFGGGAGILVLMNFERIKVYVDVASSKIDLIKVGNPALIKWKNIELEGRVFSVAQAADPASKTFRVGILAENRDLLLKPGTDVQVRLIFARKRALAVPLSSLVEGKSVFVVEKGRAIRRKVKTGLVGDELVEIVQGLKEGDRVVVENLFGLYDGALVEEEK